MLGNERVLVAKGYGPNSSIVIDEISSVIYLELNLKELGLKELNTASSTSFLRISHQMLVRSIAEGLLETPQAR